MGMKFDKTMEMLLDRFQAETRLIGELLQRERHLKEAIQGRDLANVQLKTELAASGKEVAALRVERDKFSALYDKERANRARLLNLGAAAEHLDEVLSRRVGRSSRETEEARAQLRAARDEAFAIHN